MSTSVQILPTVYSLYWPETKAVVEEMWSSKPHGWYDRVWERPDERPDLDVLKTWRRWAAFNDSTGVDHDIVEGFEHGYIANGASEVIKDLTLNTLGAHTFFGEYEGYGAIAAARNIPVYKHERGWLPSREAYDYGTVWVSDPSAIDGEHWTGLSDWLRELREAKPNYKVYLDLTYVGAVKSYRPVCASAHPNVAAVVFSLSKPFGIYQHRVGGVFSRAPIPSLEGSRWFRNIFSLKLAQRLMEKYDVTALPRKYAPAQQFVVDRLIKHGQLPQEAQASNVLLLARSEVGERPFARVFPSPQMQGAYRYCLTPALHSAIYDGIGAWAKSLEGGRS